MNIEIAEIVRQYIATASFADKVAGLVQPLNVGITDQNGNRVEKIYPVSCTYTYDECKKGKYAELIPDSRYKSIMYFEDNGLQFLERDGRWQNMASNLRLVCWANMKRLGKQDYNSPDMIMELLKILPQLPFSTARFHKMEILPTTQEVRGNNIFARYTYNEPITQYLFYPYDYFAINLNIRFKIIPQCYGFDDPCADCH